MYCSHCGNRLPQVMSYCNRCGANLKPDETKPSPTMPESLIWAIVATTITILGMILGALVMMQNNVIPFGHGSAFILVGLLALVGTDGIFIWRLFGLDKKVKIKEQTVVIQRKGFRTEEINDAEPLPLPEPAPSVTEQTTRNLEPAYREEAKQG
jgi:hypothetical protein